MYVYGSTMRSARRQHERIKFWLKLKGSSLAQIARELQVAPTTVTTVSQGMRRSRRIEAAIADRLGMAPSRLWPDRYPPLVEITTPAATGNGSGTAA